MNRFIKKLFVNFQYKITALFLAAIFWYIVQGEEVLEINRKIQVKFNVQKGYLIKGPASLYKDATLSGSRALVGDFTSSPLEAVINIPKNKVGELRFRLDKEFIPNWNPRIKLTVHDAYVNVHVEEKLTRTLQVKELLQGRPAEGYIIEQISIDPKKVLISGLKSEIGKLVNISTEPLSITGIQKSQSFEVGLLKNELGPLELSNERVKVSIQVGEEKINKKFRAIPIELEGQRFETTTTPKNVSITIQGTPGVLSFVKDTDLKAFIEVRQLEPGKYEKKTQVKIPTDTILIETEPELATVEISKNPVSDN